MIARIRQSLLRRPALLLSCALFALTSQSLAVTLDWCLHGEDAHVELAAAPHAAAVPAMAHEDCHGDGHGVSAGPDPGACDGLMFSVVIDAATTLAFVPDFTAVPAFVVYLPAVAEPGAAAAWHASRARASVAEQPPHPRIPGVRAGTSTRLLI